MTTWQDINEAYVLPALDLARGGNREAAIELLKKGRTAFPQDGYVSLNLGEMYLRDGAAQDALPRSPGWHSAAPPQEPKAGA